MPVLAVSHGFTQLIRRHEGRFVLYAQIARQLQTADASHAVHQDRHGHMIDLDWQFAAMQHGSTGDAELLGAAIVFADRTALV